MENFKRQDIDFLIEQFWKNGYLTIRRKFGTYLPEPEKIGGFDVDVIAKHNKDYALGITLTDDDFKNPSLPERIIHLATRHTRFTQKPVQLYIGVPEKHIQLAKGLLNSLSNEVKTNVKLYGLIDKSLPRLNKSQRSGKIPIS